MTEHVSILLSVSKAKNDNFYARFCLGNNIRFFKIKENLLDVVQSHIGEQVYPLLDFFEDKDGKTVVYMYGLGDML